MRGALETYGIGGPPRDQLTGDGDAYGA